MQQQHQLPRRSPSSSSSRSLPLPSSSLPPPPPSTQTLPSIRQLDPYLQLPHTMSSSSAPPEAYTYSTQFLSQREAYGGGGPESEEDQEPPKKKRRRQALSCTECKRRKIKCDRNQPCAPCARRGDQDKCQWHIVEPVEKYVTRAEYDELKTRFDQLEAFVHQRLGGGGAVSASIAIPPTYYQSGIPSGLPGTVSEPGPSSFSQSFSQPPPPPSMMYHQQQHIMPPPPPHPSYSPRHSPSVGVSVPRGQQSPSSLARIPPPPNRPQSSPQHLPHSLASITSPYNIEQQSKNSYAQMLKLGERLRPITNVSRQVVAVQS